MRPLRRPQLGRGDVHKPRSSFGAPPLPPLLPGRAAAALASLSFAVCAAAAMHPRVGTAEGAALSATLPRWAVEAQLTAHLLGLLHASVAWWLQSSRSTTAARHAGIMSYVTAISAASAALTVSGNVPARMDAWNTLARPLRIVTWMHSTPGMLLLTAELAGATRAGAGAAIALDEVMLLFGLLSQLLPAGWAHAAAAASFAVLPVLLWTLHTMFDACIARSPPNSLRARAVRACRVLSTLLWCGFGVIFAAAANGLLSHAATAVAWSFTDIAAKACFTYTLMHANTVTADEAASAALHAASDAKSRQVAQLCHELRNPLNGILGNLQELDAETSTASVGISALIATTLSCTAQLRRTLDDFLDLAKADAAALRVVRAPARLRALLGDVARQVLRAAHDKGLAVRVHVPRALAGRVVLLDGGRVQQVLANFSWNAVKVTHSGSITLRVREEPPEAGVAPSDGECGETALLFEVCDTGLGIPPDALARLFQPFEQAHDALGAGAITTKYGSTGLGLSICRVLGELLGGSVGASSTQGQGSTFWLRLRAVEWFVERPPAGTVTGSDSGEVVADAATALLRARRGARASRDASRAAAAAAQPEEEPRRHSLESVRRALGATAPASDGPPATLRAAGGLPGGARRRASADVERRLGGSKPAWSALRHAVHELHGALDDAEGAVSRRLEEPQATRGGSRDSARESGETSLATLVTPPPTPTRAAAWPGALRAVLLVDDEPVNTALVARRLKREAPDVAVTTADDGTAMVQLMVAQLCRYDVVLCDQHMRDMNGDAAVAALRAHEAASALPRALVLACTGNTCAADLALFTHAGFDGVLTKPLDMRTLLPTLAAVVQAHQSGAAVDCACVQMFAPLRLKSA